MIKKILMVVAGVVSALLLYAALKSPDVTIARELLIRATPEVIFPHLNNSRLSNAWMPWLTVDPNVKTTFSGPDAGVGSKARWESTGPMGIGNSEIVESVTNRSVKIRLAYSKPMVMTQMAEFTEASTPSGTLVRWSVAFQEPFFMRLICIFLNMNEKIGNSFSDGLKNLQGIVEAK